MTVTDDELEARIRESLDAWAITAPIGVDRAEELETKPTERWGPRQTLVAAAVLLVIGLVIAGMTRGGDEGPNTFTGPADEPARVAMGSSGVRSITSDGASVWVLSANDSTLYRIDPATQEIAGSVEVEGYFEGLAVDDGIAWLTGYDPTRLVAIDTETAEVVHEIPLDFDPWGAELALGWVWVPGGGKLTRVDPDTGEAVAFDLGRSTGFLAVADDALWITDPEGGALLKVDPTDGSVDGEVELGGRPRGVAVASDGDVWVTLPDASEVVRVDPGSLQVTVRRSVGRSPDSISFVGSEVWVTIRDDGTIARLGAEDGRVIAVHPAGSVPAGIESAFGRVWVSLHQEAAVLIIDPSEPLVTMPVTTLDEVVPIEDRAVDLRCRGAGEPTIVLLTDAARPSADLPTLEARLADRTRVCSVSRPPGEEELADHLAPDARAVLGSEVPGPYVVVGHGLSGFAARELAATWDQVQALALVDTNIDTPFDEADPILHSYGDYRSDVDQMVVVVPRLVVVSDPEVPTDDPRVGDDETRQRWFESHQRLAEELDAELIVIEGDAWLPTIRPGALADVILDLART